MAVTHNSMIDAILSAPEGQDVEDLSDDGMTVESTEDDLMARLAVGKRQCLDHMANDSLPFSKRHGWKDIKETVSNVSGIRVVPFQRYHPLPENVPQMHIHHFHEESVQKVDQGHLPDEDVSPEDDTQNLWHHKGKVLGFAKRGIRHYLDATYGSFDYGIRTTILDKVRSTREELGDANFSLEARRMLIIVVIGVLTALVATFMDQSIDYLSYIKYNYLVKLYNLAFLGKTNYLYPFFFNLIWNLVFAAVAALCVYVSPAAQGSGIPQVKCYLNGIKVPYIVRIKTLVCKAAGVVMSVIAGFVVGKEGPMIHSGSAIGAGMSQGKSTSLKFTTSFFKVFRNDKEKRDFVACGAAAGVAAAFGSPVGGIMFALEEGVSHFKQRMIWLLAICSYVSNITLSVIKSVILGVPGELSNGGLISFGQFPDAKYTFVIIFVYVIMGMFGAISGALFNAFNKHLTVFRMRHVKTKFHKFLEVLCCAVVVSTMAYCMSIEGDECETVVLSEEDIQRHNHVSFQLGCPRGMESSAATLCKCYSKNLTRAILKT